MRSRLTPVVVLASIALVSSCTDFVPDPSGSRAETPIASEAASSSESQTAVVPTATASPAHVFSVIPQEPTGPLIEGEPVSDEYDDLTYRLVLTASQDRYRAGQLIEITAAVTYLGPAETWLVRGSEAGLVGFSLRNDANSIQVSGGFTSACARYELTRAVPLEFGFSKVGAVAGDGSALAFYDDYMASDELRLPPGLWTVTAAADIDTCGDAEPHGLSASVTIEVLP